jgi:glycosyltransferase involved in cell wall biosynthesis
MASRVMVLTPDTLGEMMAGPAIRAWEIAKALAPLMEVRLVSTVGATTEHPDFVVSFSTDDQLREHAAWADIIIVQGHILRSHPWLKETPAIIVADIYDPMHLEQMEQGKDLDDESRIAVAIDTIEVLNDQIERADFMVCASEKQRDFWLGQLAAMARINPRTYDEDPSLRNLLDVVPFGVGDIAPVQNRHGIKGTVPGISPDDKVVIWGGGVYNWFDPLTLIRSIAALSLRHPDLRLYFLGVGHPNPNVPTMRMAVEARELADELGLTDRHVFFNTDWVPYGERADYLLDADLGVSTHFDHLETSFSFRTRVLDYLWASLPIVSTDGDTFAEVIRDNELGRVVPPEDEETLARAIEDLLYDEELHRATTENVKRFASSMAWSNALKPLIRFCLNPRPAADRTAGIVSERNRIMNDLNRRVDALEKSSSWRITAPLRAVTTRLSPTRREPGA